MTGLMLAGGLVTWLLLTDGVRDIAFAMAFNLLPVYLKDVGGMSIQQVGWQMSFFGMAVMAVTLPAGWLADKKGERLAIALGFVLQFMGLMVFTRAATFVTFTCAWVLMGFGVGCMSPALSSLMSKSVPEKLRGTAFGFFSTSIGLISLPAPALGAQLWQRVNPRFPFIITAWVALLAIIPVWAKLRPQDEKDG
jgi:MFS family permease